MTYLDIARAAHTDCEKSEISEICPSLDAADAAALQARIVEAVTVDPAAFDRSEYERLTAALYARAATDVATPPAPGQRTVTSRNDPETGLGPSPWHIPAPGHRVAVAAPRGRCRDSSAKTLGIPGTLGTIEKTPRNDGDLSGTGRGADAADDADGVLPSSWENAPFDCPRPWECGVHGPCPGYGEACPLASATPAHEPQSAMTQAALGGEW